MSLNSFALRGAIYTRLDAQLSAGVYSYVQQNATYPYVRIGDITAQTDDTKTSEMQLYAVTIHTFDKNAASTQTLENLMASVYSALHNYALTVSSFNVVYIRQTNMNIFQQGEPNDRYWHGVQEFEVLMEDV